MVHAVEGAVHMWVDGTGAREGAGLMAQGHMRVRAWVQVCVRVVGEDTCECAEGGCGSIDR